MTLILLGNILGWAGFAFEIVFIVSRFLRQMSVKGTRQRHMFSTIENTSLHPIVLLLLGNIMKANIIGAVLSLIVFAVLYYAWSKDHDNDDFWTKLGGKIKNKLRSLVSSAKLTPAASYN